MEESKKLHKIISCFISFFMLSSLYIPALGIYDTVSDDVRHVYQTSGFSDYYSFIALLPVKIITKFVVETNKSENIASNKKTSEKSREKKSGRNNNFDVAFVSGSINQKVSNQYDQTKYGVIPLKHEFNVFCQYFEFNMIFLSFVIMLCFCFFARGDTEDNIFNNINTQKLRLV